MGKKVEAPVCETGAVKQVIEYNIVANGASVKPKTDELNARLQADGVVDVGELGRYCPISCDFSHYSACVVS